MNSNKRFRRSAVALAAGASLVFGVSACSDEAEDAKDKAGDAANSATEKAGEAKDEAEEDASDSESSEGEDAEGSEGADAEGETEKVQTANGLSLIHI